MTKTRRFKVNKLIRDKILELQDGIVNFAYILNEKDYLYKLQEKLLEEAMEVINTKNRQELIEELADLQEVINSIAEINNIAKEEIELLRRDKAKAKGAFKGRVFLNYIEISSDHEKISYYLANPDKYPEIE